jgi:hypothetical protein
MSYDMNLSFHVSQVSGANAGQPATGLSNSDFTTMKIYQDGVLGADIHATAVIHEDGAGDYHIAALGLTASQELRVICVMASTVNVATPTPYGAATLALIGNSSGLEQLLRKVFKIFS